MVFLEEPKNPGLDDGKCALCKKPIEEDDAEELRCLGCGYLICEDHDINPILGPHFVINHDDKIYP